MLIVTFVNDSVILLQIYEYAVMIYIMKYQDGKTTSEILFKLSNASSRKTFYRGENALKIAFYFLLATLGILFITGEVLASLKYY